MSKVNRSHEKAKSDKKPLYYKKKRPKIRAFFSLISFDDEDDVGDGNQKTRAERNKSEHVCLLREQDEAPNQKSGDYKHHKKGEDAGENARFFVPLAFCGKNSNSRSPYSSKINSKANSIKASFSQTSFFPRKTNAAKSPMTPSDAQSR